MTTNIDEPVVARLQREVDELRTRQDATDARIAALEVVVVGRAQDIRLLARCVEDDFSRRHRQGRVIRRVGEEMMVKDPDAGAIEELVARLGEEIRNAAAGGRNQRDRRRSS